ncbi:MAG: hypothetical protein KAT83_03425 [Candidatus Aenigmarchaeota archaeon]|nr:hypothetical protein [Candidatus Aenigmarchaeota archaeon]
MTIEQLKYMKAHMAERGNWKEVERINKMLHFNNQRKTRARSRTAKK